MCVIILRNPGVSIPFEKIRSACIVNPDGWGLAVADRGKLTLTKGLDKATDPDKIYQLLEDAKNHSVMLHLRFVTAGARTLENCHPWLFLEHDKHGIDAAFCHNGTLYQWKDNEGDRPDSWHINERLVKPLYERVAAYAGPENALRDEFAIDLLDAEAGTNSLFGLMDGNGLQLAINHSQGTEFDGWWASNEYSFKSDHREPVKTTTTYGSHYPTTAWQQDDAEYYNSNVVPYAPPAQDKDKDETEDTEPTPLVTEDDDMEEMEEILEQCEKIKETLDAMKTNRMNPKLVRHCLEQKYPSFTTLCKIDSLREMTRFDPEDLTELAIFYPEATGVLLKDLLHELYFKSLAEQKRKNDQAKKAA